ncbi:hypothetical protein [Methylocystis sp. S23]
MTQAMRKNVYLDARTLDLIGRDDSLSGSIRRIVDRYAEFVRRERPWEMFEAAELDAIRDACLSWAAEPAATIIGGIALEIRDADVDGLGRKWGVDAAALADKIDALSPARQIALMDWIERQRNATETDAKF